MPCNAEAPHLQRLFERVRHRGGTVIGIAMGNDREPRVVRFRGRHRLTYQVVFDRDDVFDSGRTDVPYTILAGPDGVIRWLEEGFDPEAFASLQTRFEALLPGDSDGRGHGGAPSRPSPAPKATRTASSARP
jgi:hypothetical protein